MRCAALLAFGLATALVGCLYPDFDELKGGGAKKSETAVSTETEARDAGAPDAHDSESDDCDLVPAWINDTLPVSKFCR